MILNPLSRSRNHPRRVFLLLGSASAAFYLLAFTLPCWLPTYYLNVRDEIYQFAARELWRGVLFHVALGLLFLFYWAACRLARRASPQQIGASSVALWSVWPDARRQVILGVKSLTALVFVPFCLSRMWAARHGVPGRRGWGDPLRASFDVTLFYLLFVGFQFWPWYLTWLMVPAALLADSLRRRQTVVLCVMAPLLYFPFGWQWARSDLPTWGMSFLSSLPLLGPCGWLGVRAWLRRAGDLDESDALATQKERAGSLVRPARPLKHK
jgi:hypothetical protein